MGLIFGELFLEFSKAQSSGYVIDQWFPGEGRSGREELQRGTKKALLVVDMVIILITVMISRVYTYVKTDQIVQF